MFRPVQLTAEQLVELFSFATHLFLVDGPLLTDGGTASGLFSNSVFSAPSMILGYGGLNWCRSAVRQSHRRESKVRVFRQHKVLS